MSTGLLLNIIWGFTRDKQSICHQISSGKLDNAVQATHYINNAISSSVSASTVRRALKENNFWSVVKSKHPLLIQIHLQKHLKFAQYHANAPISNTFVCHITPWAFVQIMWFKFWLKAGCYGFYNRNFHSNSLCNHFTIYKSLKNVQTLEQFFEPVYIAYILHN